MLSHLPKPKWVATAQAARSDHPCSPNSKWRKYTYIKQDRQDTNTAEIVWTTFETVPEEAHLVTTLYEADRSTDASCRSCVFQDGLSSIRTGYSGTGFCAFSGTNDYIEWTINVEKGGIYPVSFRYSQGSAKFNGNRPLNLYVNGALIQSMDFMYTNSWNYWRYSDLVPVTLRSGMNAIKLLVVAQNGGPLIDHMRIGKPPAVVLKTNGWPRTVAKNGVGLLDEWGFEFTNETSVWFSSYPDPPQGDLVCYVYGRTKVGLPDGRLRYLDIGNVRG